MKSRIWLAAGIAGAVLGTFSMDAHADGWRHYRGWGWPYGGRGGGISFVIDTRPNFVVLPSYGFSVAVGSPYDMLYYDNLYYIYNNAVWYRSSYYSGPWVVVREESLPETIRRERIEDIRRRRDTEAPKSAGHRDDRNSNVPGAGEVREGSGKAE
ncbi:MAG: hypothetical protein WCH05_07390 [Chlorobiaceae bacterium]